MAGHIDDPNWKYAYLNRLSTERLYELYQVDINADLDEEEEAYYDALMEVILKREKEHPTGRLTDVDEAWAEFQKHYQTPEGDGLSLFIDDLDEALPPAADQPSLPTPNPKTKLRIRYILAAAAIVVLLVVFALPPALGYENFVQMIGVWTEDTFRFSSSPDQESKDRSTGDVPADGPASYQTLREALNAYDIDIPVPEIPAGFEQVQIDVTENMTLRSIDFFAGYVDGDATILVHYVNHENGTAYVEYEKDDTEVKPYIVGDIEHYLFENNSASTATWYISNTECLISTKNINSSITDLVDSMYKG